MHFVARRLFNSLSLSLSHTRSRVDTFLFRIHLQCTHTTVLAWDTLLQHAMLHSVTSFLTAGLLFLLRQRSFSYFVRFCHTSRPTSIARQLIHAHTHTRIGSGSVAGGRPHQYKRTKLFGPSLLLALSLSLALSRCVFSLSSLKVKEEGCRCRCRRSRRWQRAASSDRRSRLQLSQRTKLSDHCNVGRWILRLQRWAVLQELISIKTVNILYILWIFWIIFKSTPMCDKLTINIYLNLNKY